MGLVKRTAKVVVDERAAPRTFEELLCDLAGAEPAGRRAAARAMAARPGGAGVLCERLTHEIELSVRESILTELMTLATEEVALGLIRCLASEDVWLRNAAIEALPRMPNACRAPLVRRLLHPEADVRILSVTALAQLHEPEVTARLVQVLAEDPDVNVCSAALEAITEIGTGSALPVVEALPARFPDEPFIAFATGVAVARIAARET